MSINVSSNLSLSDFRSVANAGTGSKTSVEKNSRGDGGGKVRLMTNGKGDNRTISVTGNAAAGESAKISLLRAFQDAHATSEFLHHAAEKLGVKADFSKSKADFKEMETGVELKCRDVTNLMDEFNSGEFTTVDGEKKESMRTAVGKQGPGDWTVVVPEGDVKQEVAGALIDAFQDKVACNDLINEVDRTDGDSEQCIQLLGDFFDKVATEFDGVDDSTKALWGELSDSGRSIILGNVLGAPNGRVLNAAVNHVAESIKTPEDAKAIKTAFAKLLNRPYKGSEGVSAKDKFSNSAYVAMTRLFHKRLSFYVDNTVKGLDSGFSIVDGEAIAELMKKDRELLEFAKTDDEQVKFVDSNFRAEDDTEAAKAKAHDKCVAFCKVMRDGEKKICDDLRAKKMQFTAASARRFLEKLLEAEENRPDKFCFSVGDANPSRGSQYACKLRQIRVYVPKFRDAIVDGLVAAFNEIIEKEKDSSVKALISAMRDQIEGIKRVDAKKAMQEEVESAIAFHEMDLADMEYWSGRVEEE